MPSNDNHIYDRQTGSWFDVTPEQFQEYDRWRTRIRKREQAHGHCVCPRSKWWLCDGMCQDCGYHAAGDTISLDTPFVNSDGDEITLADDFVDRDSLFDSIICDKAEMDMLFARLEELMPEARQIGLLRQKGLSDEEIARVIGINRTTFLYRLKKAKAKLLTEYPDQF